MDSNPNDDDDSVADPDKPLFGDSFALLDRLVALADLDPGVGHCDADPDDYFNPNAYPDSLPDAFPPLHADAHGDMDSLSYVHANPNADSNPDRDADSLPAAHVDANSDRDFHAHRNGDLDAHRHAAPADRNQHGNGDSGSTF